MLLAIGSLAHVSASVVRRRAMDLAVLRVLGLTPRRVQSTLSWPATTVALLGLLVGLPLGLWLGQTGWRSVANAAPMLYVAPEHLELIGSDEARDRDSVMNVDASRWPRRSWRARVMTWSRRSAPRSGRDRWMGDRARSGGAAPAGVTSVREKDVAIARSARSMTEYHHPDLLDAAVRRELLELLDV